MKAILVIEMPSSCSECPCCYVPRCEVNEKSLKTSEIYECKPDWCPLKPMPEKKELKNIECGYNEYSNTEFWEAVGYNACIDEILGDSENE